MRITKEVKIEVLSRAGRYREVHPEGSSAKDSSPLTVKEVVVNGRRYIVCLNEKQARKDAQDRKLDRKTVLAVNQEKIEEEARYDGKWVLKTNTTLTAEQEAPKYKELWQVGVSREGRTPKKKARLSIKAKIREIIKNGGATPAKELINTALGGWVEYFRVGNSSRAFSEVQDYLEMKVQTLLTRRKRRQKRNVGWRWCSNEYLYGVLGLFWDWKIHLLQNVEAYS
jgi:hypothetical protein